MEPIIKVPFGQGQIHEEAFVQWTNSNGVAVLTNPGGGKSNFIQTFCLAALKEIPNLKIDIFSIAKFDYVGFPFTFHSPVTGSREECLEWLQKDYQEQIKLLKEMERRGVKDVRDLGTDFVPHLLVVDELEALEMIFEQEPPQEKGAAKKQPDIVTFSRLLTMRIILGRKIQRVTICAAQSQDFNSALRTRIRSLEYFLIGRPQNPQVAHTLGVSARYCEDFDLKKGRLILIRGDETQIVQVDKT